VGRRSFRLAAHPPRKTCLSLTAIETSLPGFGWEKAGRRRPWRRLAHRGSSPRPGHSRRCSWQGREREFPREVRVPVHDRWSRAAITRCRQSTTSARTYGTPRTAGAVAIGPLPVVCFREGPDLKAPRPVPRTDRAGARGRGPAVAHSRPAPCPRPRQRGLVQSSSTGVGHYGRDGRPPRNWQRPSSALPTASDAA